MPKEETIEDPSEAAKPKKSRKLLLILVGAVIILGGAGGGAYFYLGSAQAKPGAKKEVVKGPPVFVKFEPMVVNLNSDMENHYLQVNLEMKTYDPKVAEEIKVQMPVLRDGILTILGGQNPDTVTGLNEREKLRKSILAFANQTLGKAQAEEGDKKHAGRPVDGVYFTGFVVQ